MTPPESLTVSIPEVETALRVAKGAADLEPVLRSMTSLQRVIETNGSLYGRKLFFDGIDALLPAICEKLGMADAAPRVESNDRVAILATEVYPIGGHTRIIEDIQRSLPPGSCRLILSDPNGHYDHFGPAARNLDFIRPMFDSILICKNPSVIGRCFEIYALLRAIDPSRVFLLGHHGDITPALACWPFREVVNFIHHTDYLPCIGASTGAFKHLDVTYACHSRCREHVRGARYVGMSLPYSVKAQQKDLAPRTRLTVATSGTQRKFNGSRLFRWTDWAIAALSSSGEVDLKHIGPVTPEFAAGVHAALSEHRIDPRRYEFVGQVRSVAAALDQCSADVYLSSYPEAGFRANLEALASGLPVVVLEDDSTPDLLRFKFPAAGWLSVQTPSELPGALTRALQSHRPCPEAIQAELDRFGAFMRSEGAAEAVAGAP